MNMENRTRGFASAAEIRLFRLEDQSEALGSEVFPTREVEKFLARLVRLPSGCVEYRGKRGQKLSTEYPSVKWVNADGERRSAEAHRIGGLLHLGPHQPGKLACHHCSNTQCVAHLYYGSPSDNSNDRWRMARTVARIGRKVATVPLRPRAFVCEAVAA